MIFRPGTVDEDCWRGIVEGNEYNLPDTLPVEALIVDIGTHVGSFVQAAWNRGARNIFSYEADPSNFAVAVENVGHLAGVTLVNAAVGRSDHRAQPSVTFTGHVPFFDGRINTGGGSIFGDAKPGSAMVSCVAFDSIAPGHIIDLLKIDCEGSEWPILMRSDLSRVQRICGEYHSLPAETMEALGLPIFEWYRGGAPELLRLILRNDFKSIDVQPPNQLHAQMHGGQQIGLFSASR